jgi:hypothetical protein
MQLAAGAAKGTALLLAFLKSKKGNGMRAAIALAVRRPVLSIP